MSNEEGYVSEFESCPECGEEVESLVVVREFTETGMELLMEMCISCLGTQMRDREREVRLKRTRKRTEEHL